MDAGFPRDNIPVIAAVFSDMINLQDVPEDISHIVKLLRGCYIHNIDFLCSGVNPRLLKGQKIGVFVGACYNETESVWNYEKPHENGYGLTGCARAAFANLISYWLGITGKLFLIPKNPVISVLLSLPKNLHI